MYSWQSLNLLQLQGELAGDRWPIKIYGRAASIRAAATQRQWTRDLLLGIGIRSQSASDSDWLIFCLKPSFCLGSRIWPDRCLALTLLQRFKMMSRIIHRSTTIVLPDCASWFGSGACVCSTASFTVRGPLLFWSHNRSLIPDRTWLAQRKESVRESLDSPLPFTCLSDISSAGRALGEKRTP